MLNANTHVAKPSRPTAATTAVTWEVQSQVQRLMPAHAALCAQLYNSVRDTHLHIYILHLHITYYGVVLVSSCDCNIQTLEVLAPAPSRPTGVGCRCRLSMKRISNNEMPMFTRFSIQRYGGMLLLEA